MTDVTSEKLYEKLDRINNVKRNLKRVMTDIGGYEFFQNDPKFETYPEILCQIQDRIEVIKRLLDVSVYGKEINTVMTTAETTYSKIVPYLNELQSCRGSLIDNLNTKGVIADTDETLRSLVDKVLDIKSGGGGSDVTTEILAIDYIDNFKVELIYNKGYYTYSEPATPYSEVVLKFTNISDQPIILKDPFYRATVYTGDFSLSYTTIVKDSWEIYPNSYNSFYLLGSWGGDYDEEVTNFVNKVKETGATINIFRFYVSRGRSGYVTVDDPGYLLNYILVRFNANEYYLEVRDCTYSGYPITLHNDINLIMKYDMDPSITNELYTWSAQRTIGTGGYTYMTLYLYSQEDIDLFDHYLTNEIEFNFDIPQEYEEVLYSTNLAKTTFKVVNRVDNAYPYYEFMYRFSNDTDENVSLNDPAYYIKTIMDPGGIEETVYKEVIEADNMVLSPNGYWNHFLVATSDPDNEYYKKYLRLINYGFICEPYAFYPQRDGKSGTVYLPGSSSYYMNYTVCPIMNGLIYIYYSYGSNDGSTEIVSNNSYTLRMVDPNTNFPVVLANIGRYNGIIYWSGYSHRANKYIDQESLDCIANYMNNTYEIVLIN